MPFTFQRCCVACAVMLYGNSALLTGLTPAWGAEGKTSKKVGPELLFYGPFALDELYDKVVPEGSRDDVLSQGEGPTRQAIKEAMGHCKVYLVARKVKRDGKWGLTYEGGYPKILVEGKLVLNIKDKKGRDYEIQVQEISRVGADMGPEWQTCKFPLRLCLKVRRNFVTEADIELAKRLAQVGGKKLTARDFEGASSSFVRNFVSEASFTHDVDGKARWSKEE
jgi:hypothetical protein